MKYFLACTSGLVLSFTVTAAQKNEMITYTEPPLERSLHLTCKGYQVKEKSLTKIEGFSYLEGAGEQIVFAIMTPDGLSNRTKVFFDSWDFTSSGLVRSHVMNDDWSLVHVGGRASIEMDKIDYSFFDNRLQDMSSYEPRSSILLYDCHDTGKRPSWVDRIYEKTKIFNGSIESRK